jgi:hypothetical protein
MLGKLLIFADFIHPSTLLLYLFSVCGDNDETETEQEIGQKTAMTIFKIDKKGFNKKLGFLFLVATRFTT